MLNQSKYIVVTESAEVSDGYNAVVHMAGTKDTLRIVCLAQLPNCVGLVEGRSFPVQIPSEH